jgi:hypothetical protein
MKNKKDIIKSNTGDLEITKTEMEQLSINLETPRRGSRIKDKDAPDINIESK